MVGMLPRPSPAMYQRQSNRRSDSIPNSSRLPPLQTPVSTVIERDGDGGNSPAG